MGWGRSFPSTQQWWGHSWSGVPTSGLPSTRKTWTYWREFSDRFSEDDGRDWIVSAVRKSWEREAKLPSPERRLRGIWLMCLNTWREGGNKVMGMNWDPAGSFWMSGNTFSLWGNQVLAQVAWKSWGAFYLGDVPKPFEHSVWSKWLLLEQEMLDEMTSLFKLEVLPSFNHFLLCIVPFQIWSGSICIKTVILAILNASILPEVKSSWLFNELHGSPLFIKKLQNVM